MIIDTRTAFYVTQIASNWMNVPDQERYQLTLTCPECEDTVTPQNTGDHLVIDVREGEPGAYTSPENAPEGDAFIAVACEGYWLVNPVWAGIMPEGENGWSPPSEDQPAWDGKGVNPYDVT